MNLNFAEKAVFLRFERISQFFRKIYCVCEEKVVSLHALCVSITSKLVGLAELVWLAGLVPLVVLVRLATETEN